jgi:hypothetical protein
MKKTAALIFEIILLVLLFTTNPISKQAERNSLQKASLVNITLPGAR